jgi:hypothetical protein
MRVVAHEWTHTTGWVAIAGRLNLDDLGTIVGQHLGTERRGDPRSQVEDSQSGEQG